MGSESADSLHRVTHRSAPARIRAPRSAAAALRIPLRTEFAPRRGARRSVACMRCNAPSKVRTGCRVSDRVRPEPSRGAAAQVSREERDAAAPRGVEPPGRSLDRARRGASLIPARQIPVRRHTWRPEPGPGAPRVALDPRPGRSRCARTPGAPDPIPSPSRPQGAPRRGRSRPLAARPHRAARTRHGGPSVPSLPRRAPGSPRRLRPAPRRMP